jgi:hypothetical protein
MAQSSFFLIFDNIKVVDTLSFGKKETRSPSRHGRSITTVVSYRTKVASSPEALAPYLVQSTQRASSDDNRRTRDY